MKILYQLPFVIYPFIKFQAPLEYTSGHKSNKNHYPIDDALIAGDDGQYQNLHILWLQWLAKVDLKSTQR
jgi:hypothetical protein